MKSSYKIPILLLIFGFLFLAFSNLKEPSPVTSTFQDPEIKTQQKNSHLLNMSDLEAIKKSADYLKSLGKDLMFQETEIQYIDNDELSLIFKDNNNEDVYYKGNYLLIHFYPHEQSQDLHESIRVYIGDHGKVLGYSSHPYSNNS